MPIAIQTSHSDGPLKVVVVVVVCVCVFLWSSTHRISGARFLHFTYLVLFLGGCDDGFETGAAVHPIQIVLWGQSDRTITAGFVKCCSDFGICFSHKQLGPKVLVLPEADNDGCSE